MSELGEHYEMPYVVIDIPEKMTVWLVFAVSEYEESFDFSIWSSLQLAREQLRKQLEFSPYYVIKEMVVDETP